MSCSKNWNTVAREGVSVGRPRVNRSVVFQQGVHTTAASCRREVERRLQRCGSVALAAPRRDDKLDSVHTVLAGGIMKSGESD